MGLPFNKLLKMPVDFFQSRGHLRAGHAAKGLPLVVQPRDKHPAVVRILSDVSIVLEPSLKRERGTGENLPEYPYVAREKNQVWIKCYEQLGKQIRSS